MAKKKLVKKLVKKVIKRTPKVEDITEASSPETSETTLEETIPEETTDTTETQSPVEVEEEATIPVDADLKKVVIPEDVSGKLPVAVPKKVIVKAVNTPNLAVRALSAFSSTVAGTRYNFKFNDTVELPTHVAKILLKAEKVELV